MEKMKVVIVTGLSGAGKTNAADWFEDQGYYCVDNMPPALIRNFIDLTVYSNKKINKAAFVVDVRGGEFFTDLSECLDYLEKSEAIDVYKRQFPGYLRGYARLAGSPRSE